MTVTHPMQRDLKTAIEERERARTWLNSVQTKADSLSAELETMEANAQATHQAFKNAAGSCAVGEIEQSEVNAAQKAHRAALDAFDDAVIVHAGVTERLAKAETEFEGHERAVALIASRLAVLIASRVEAEATALAAKLGETLARHHRIAQLAKETASEAQGGFAEPIDISSESTPFKRHITELLSSRSPLLVVDDLLRATVAP